MLQQRPKEQRSVLHGQQLEVAIEGLATPRLHSTLRPRDVEAHRKGLDT